MSFVSRLNALTRVAVLFMVFAISSQAVAMSGAGGPSTDLIQAVAIR